MTRIQVNHTALRNLGDSLLNLAPRLARLVELSHEAKGDLGAPELDAALRDFLKGWEDGVEQVKENTASVGEQLRDTALSYRTSDKTLAKEFDEASGS